jgi:ABC-type lipopolysaccharide export system ATPase subunit
VTWQDDAIRDGGVTTRDLGKRFGDLWALRGLDLDVAPGTVLGLLGHNGAGKTTAIRILTTLSVPTTGAAFVAGADVVHEPAVVRRRVGVAAQQATVDGLMTAHSNLVMVGRLHHLSKPHARARASELLERLDLADVSTRLVKTFSGGMRRRLDLAASLVAAPKVLFPTSPPPASIRAAATTCGTCCAVSFATAPPSCSPPNTSKKPIDSPTTSWCSTTAGASRTERPIS